MSDYLKEGTVVHYKTDEYSLVGEIVGLACAEQAIVGMTYIIKIISKSGNINYEYSCITLPRIMFKLDGE
jgi:hypothetical protein